MYVSLCWELNKLSVTDPRSTTPSKTPYDRPGWRSSPPPEDAKALNPNFLISQQGLFNDLKDGQDKVVGLSLPPENWEV